jgi:DNA-binding transcriptional LysR family regulator
MSIIMTLEMYKVKYYIFMVHISVYLYKRGQIMTLRHLHTFITVCHDGSFVAAAETLHISQPAVSFTIKELEEYYGFKLFERISRKLFITPGGKEIYEYASRILALFDEMNLISETLKKRYTVRVGTGLAYGELVMPKIAGKFLENNKDTNLRVSVNTYLAIKQQIMNNELDIGIIDVNIQDPNNLEHIVFQENPLVVVCNKNNPLAQKQSLSIKDLADQKFILGEKFSDTRAAVENIFLSNKMHVNIIWETASIIASINAVTENLGVGVLPLNYVNLMRNDNIVVLNIAGFNLKRSVNLIYLKEKHLSKAVLDFIEFCRTFESYR